MYIILICIFSILFIFFSMIGIGYYSWYRQEQSRKNLFERYHIVLAIFNEAKILSYDKVYREKLLAHSASGFRINNIELEEMGREYINHVIVCCGPNIIKDMENIHGDYDSICSLLLHGFQSKVLDSENRIMMDVVENDDYPQ
jgi:hypothetical protein